MSPTLSEKCQFHVIPPTGSLGPLASSVKTDEQEDMETDKEGQLSVTINVHVGQ